METPIKDALQDVMQVNVVNWKHKDLSVTSAAPHSVTKVLSIEVFVILMIYFI